MEIRDVGKDFERSGTVIEVTSRHLYERSE
jgi:hypothetical protein